MFTYPGKYSLLQFSEQKMCYLNLILILPTVHCTSAGGLLHKSNTDAPVYNRKDLFNMSNIVKQMQYIEYYNMEQ